MYNSSQYCHTNSHLNKEKISVGGSLKKYHCKQCHLSFNGFVNAAVLIYEKYVKAQHNIDGKLHKQRYINKIFICNRTNSNYRGVRPLRTNSFAYD